MITRSMGDPSAHERSFRLNRIDELNNRDKLTKRDLPHCILRLRRSHFLIFALAVSSNKHVYGICAFEGDLN